MFEPLKLPHLSAQARRRERVDPAQAPQPRDHARPRRLTGKPADGLLVPPEAFVQQAASTPPPVRDLRQALEQYEQTLHHLEIRFDSPGPLLAGNARKVHSAFG